MSEPSVFEQALAEMRRALENAVRCAQAASRSAPDHARRDAVAMVAAFHVVDALEQLSAVEQMRDAEPIKDVERKTGINLEVGEGVVMGEATLKAKQTTYLSQIFSGKGESIIGEA